MAGGGSSRGLTRGARPRPGHAASGVLSFGARGSVGAAAAGRSVAAGGGYDTGYASWIDRDVVRLSPGAYGGDGNVLLDIDKQLIEVVSVDADSFDGGLDGGGFLGGGGRMLKRNSNNNNAGFGGAGTGRASVDCRDAEAVARGGGGGGGIGGGGSSPLFASQRVQLGVAPTAGSDGGILGPGAVSFTRVDTVGCYEDGGREALINAECGARSPPPPAEGDGAVRGGGGFGGGGSGCRGDDHYVHPGHGVQNAVGGRARDPTHWESFDYDDDPVNDDSTWYDYDYD